MNAARVVTASPRGSAASETLGFAPRNGRNVACIFFSSAEEKNAAPKSASHAQTRPLESPANASAYTRPSRSSAAAAVHTGAGSNASPRSSSKRNGNARTDRSRLRSSVFFSEGTNAYAVAPPAPTTKNASGESHAPEATGSEVESASVGTKVSTGSFERFFLVSVSSRF